ncbi:MAG: C2H2-type zinc finger protein [Phycisphaerales bacterium]|nr:C2H2-type zinc finger protein [Phycisphaerales bacterium]
MAAPLGEFNCEKCDRKFVMAAHLARHMIMTHGQKKKGAGKAGAAKGRPAMKRRGPGRPPGRPAGRPVGRPLGRPPMASGVGSRLGLRTMSLEQIAAVIDAARDEARRRIADYRQAFE